MSGDRNAREESAMLVQPHQGCGRLLPEIVGSNSAPGLAPTGDRFFAEQPKLEAQLQNAAAVADGFA
jgi:hypothetical protein